MYIYTHIYICITYIAAVPECLETVITNAGHSDKSTDYVFLDPAIPCDTTVAKTESQSQWSPRCPVQAFLVI